MRLKMLLILSAAAAATALPANAQGLRGCQDAKRDNQVGGAILGGIIGGVLGSNVAASGHRSDGGAVGAVLGGLVGSGIGGSSVRCGPDNRYPPGSTVNPNPNYGGAGYNDYGYAGQGYSPYGSTGYGYQSGPVNMYPNDYGYSQPRYGSDPYYLPQAGSRGRTAGSLYPDDDRDYRQNGDYAGRDCSDAVQITRLPDGSEVRRPVEVCRDAHYGDWQIKD